MGINLSGWQRIWVVISIAWMLYWFFEPEPWKYDFPYGGWKDFMVAGIGPIAIFVAVTWIRRGFQNARKLRNP
jgi:hypothetical protein